MTCSRCRGFITVEGCIDAEEDGLGQRWIAAWHCVSCGQASDPGTQRDSRNPQRMGGTVKERPKVRRGVAAYSPPAPLTP